MRRRYYIMLLAVALSAASAARAEDKPSVEVQLAHFKKGSLPRTVTAYGTVAPSAAAQRMIVAPAAAVVDEIDVRQGQEVDDNAPLLRLSPNPAAQAAYSQAESALRVATDLAARTRNMVQQHLATAQQLAAAEKSQADARASLAALQAQGAGGARTLKAPFRAVVTAIATSPGALVSEGSALLSLAGAGGLVLQAGVLPSDAAAIAVDDPATVKAVGQKTGLPGKVLLRGAMVDSTSGMIPVELALPDGKFLPGQPAVATITTGEVTGYIVPHDAILADDHGHPYIVQAPNMTAKQVPVRVLDRAGDQDLVDGALDPSIPLVLAGNYQLKDGMKMRTSEAANPTKP